MSYNEYEAQRRKLMLLRLLKADSDYQSNITILQEMLKRQGYAASMTQLQSDCLNLESLGLLTLKTLPGTTVVKITNAGVDVASGVATVDGVARPNPDELD